MEATIEDADGAGEGVRNGTEKREREGVSGRWENTSVKTSRVEETEGDPEASGVAGTPGVDRQGVVGGVESTKGIDTHEVGELPWGDKTSGVTLEGDGVPGTDGLGWGGDGKYPATHETKGTTVTRHGEDMSGGKEPAAVPSATRGTTEGERYRETYVSTQRNSYGTNKARTEHGAFGALQVYDLLAREGSTDNIATAGTLGSGEKPKETTGKVDTNET